jgi:phage tail-like protein
MTSEEIAALLTEVLRREASSGVMATLLAIMAHLQKPIDQTLEALDQHVDPYACPERFVPMLASWVQLQRIFSDANAISVEPAEHRSSCPLSRVRELVAEAAACARERGTARGLRRMLILATGCRELRVDEAVAGADGQPRPFHIRILVPQRMRPHRALIERIVGSEKPAYITHQIDVIPTAKVQAT